MPDGKSSRAGRTDWKAFRAMSENETERMVAEDEDNPGSDEVHWWAEATVDLPPGRTSIHASFDRDVAASRHGVGRFRGARRYARPTPVNAVQRAI